MSQAKAKSGGSPLDGPGNSGDDGSYGLILANVVGGNGECHCVHVAVLQEEMVDVKTQLQHMQVSFGAKPLMPARDNDHDSKAPQPTATDVPLVMGTALPLKLGPM